MVNSTGSQPALNDFEASALTKHKIGGGDSDILKRNVAMPMGSVIISIDLKHPVDGDTLGIGGDQDDRLLFVRVLVVRVGLAHHDVNLTPWVSCTTRPPFLRPSANMDSFQNE
jgi:hypothetical protein